MDLNNDNDVDFDLHNDPAVHDDNDGGNFSIASGTDPSETSTPTSSSSRRSSLARHGRPLGNAQRTRSSRPPTDQHRAGPLHGDDHEEMEMRERDAEEEGRGEESYEDDTREEEDVFLRRIQDLQRLVTDYGEPLPPRAAVLYGPTERFSTRNIVVHQFEWVFGPQVWQMVASIGLYSIPTLLMSIIGASVGAGLLIVTWLAWLLTTICLVRTGSRDPGIIPKRMEQLDPPPSKVNVQIESRQMVLRYCVSCDVYRGPRTHHCGICGNCVDQFDHHCPWTGTCIGAGNYHWFLCFLHALHLLAALLVTDSTVAVLRRSDEDRISVPDALLELYYFPIVVFIIVFLGGLTVTGLLLFHWFLLTKNLTTAEFLKSVYGNPVKDNPWDLGGWMLNTKAKWMGWVDQRTRHWNYQCLVVREVVARQRRILLQERQEFYHEQHQQQQQQEESRRTANRAMREVDPQYSPRNGQEEDDNSSPVFPTLEVGNVALYI